MKILTILTASLVAQTVKSPWAMQETRFNPLVRNISWRRECQPTSVFLPGEFHGQRSLVGYSPWGCKESDTTNTFTLTGGPVTKILCVHCKRHRFDPWLRN